MPADDELRDEIVLAARILSRLGLVDAFGHVSGRLGDLMVITPSCDLFDAVPPKLIAVNLEAGSLPPGTPAEAWAHLAIYRARPDVGAVARAQPPAALAAAASVAELPITHGQAAWLGEHIPVHTPAVLLRQADLAAAAASQLGSSDAMLLRGNGAIAVGASPGLAVARMWLLSSACDIWLRAAVVGKPATLSVEEVASWRATAPELLPRLWRYLCRIAGNGADVQPKPADAQPKPADARSKPADVRSNSADADSNPKENL